MKKFEVVIKGAHEEEIGHEILQGIYAAIQAHGYTDVSVHADTIDEKKCKELQIPEFLTNYGRSRAVEPGRMQARRV